MTDYIAEGQTIYQNGKAAAAAVHNESITGVVGGATLISQQLGIVPVTDALNDAAGILSASESGAAAGSLLGPTGMIVGAAVGAIISFAESIAAGLGRGPTPPWEEILQDPPFPHTVANITLTTDPTSVADGIYKLWRLTCIDEGHAIAGVATMQDVIATPAKTHWRQQNATNLGYNPTAAWDAHNPAYVAHRKMLRWAPCGLAGSGVTEVDWPDPNPSAGLGQWVPWPWVVLSLCAAAQLSDEEAMQYFTTLYTLYELKGGAENATFEYWIGRLGELSRLQKKSGMTSILKGGSPALHAVRQHINAPSSGPKVALVGTGLVGLLYLLKQYR